MLQMLRVMDESEIIETWEERAAIMEFLGEQATIDRLAGRDWRRECEKRAYFLVKQELKVEKMPDQTAGWMKSKR